MSFNVVTKTHLPLPPIPLRPQGIAELLQHYPDKHFVDNLISIAIHGARIGYEGPPASTRRPNHASALMHPDIINASIQSELDKGRIKELTDLPKHYFCSPIGLVPKKIDGAQTGWRTIFDLSCPEFFSINDGILKQYGTISYESLETAIQLIAQVGKGAVMMKRDLKSAFHHIPISPHDYWLLIFESNGKFYVDMFLPFGLRTALRIFNLFSEALHWIFEILLGWNLTNYLDDFLFRVSSWHRYPSSFRPIQMRSHINGTRKYSRKGYEWTHCHSPWLRI